MPSVFENIQDRESVIKLRIIAICAFASSFIFYYFMEYISPDHVDWLPGRLIVAFLSAIGLVGSFKKGLSFTSRRYCMNLVCAGYIIMYLYLLHINDWSVFHRWSYFVVIAIMATVVFSWVDYIYTAFWGMVLPIISGYWSPLTALELVHFDSVNFVTFFVIGLTVRANFLYRDEVIKLTNSMVQNSKMIALGEMSEGLSHEINNPLTIITTSSEQIENSLDELNANKNLIRSSIDKINKASLRIAKVVQGLHNFSQSDNKEPFTTINILDVVDETTALFLEKFRVHGIKFIFLRPDENYSCHCQRQQIVQLLSNVIQNAFDACTTIPLPEINISIQNNNQHIFISVCDNGPGVPVSIEQQILQPFFTTKPIGKGTGLGLSIAVGIARFNNGDLYLDSRGQPTCFTLKLPLSVH